LKKFKPILIDVTESVELQSVLKEIEVLKRLSWKSDYVINYLDSFTTILEDEYKVYHIVTNIYEVNFNLTKKEINKLFKEFSFLLQGWHFGRRHPR